MERVPETLENSAITARRIVSEWIDPKPYRLTPVVGKVDSCKHVGLLSWDSIPRRKCFTTFPFRPANGTRINEHNAHLIAASPDLYAALEAVLIMWDRGECPKKLHEALGWHDNDIVARKMATDALAKARGEK